MGFWIVGAVRYLERDQATQRGDIAARVAVPAHNVPMKLKVALTHRTEYRYDRRVALGPHVVRLRPAPYCRTPILGYSMRIAPAPHFVNWMQDPFGNLAARVAVPERRMPSR